MNTGTKLRTFLAIVTCLNTALLVTDVAQFNNPTLDVLYRGASVILNCIIVALTTYFNNDYSEEGCVGTGTTRLLKAQAKDNKIEWTEDMTDPVEEEEGDDDE